RRLAFPERSVDLRHGRAAIGLTLAVEPLLMGAEIGDPRPDLGLEILPQVESRQRSRPRYLPWYFFSRYFSWRLGRGQRHRQQSLDVGKDVRKGCGRADGFGCLDGEQRNRRRDRLLGLRHLAGHRLDERHRLRDQEIAFPHPFHETPRPKSLHQTAFVESSGW